MPLCGSEISQGGSQCNAKAAGFWGADLNLMQVSVSCFVDFSADLIYVV